MTLVVTHTKVSGIADDPGASAAGEVLPSDWNADHTLTGTSDASQLNSDVVQAVTNDTNIQGSIATQTLTFSWAGTLAAARLNSKVVQGITDDTNVTGTISAQVLTLGWTGTLAASRLNSNVVQAITDDTNITGTIATQTLTLGWTGTLAAGRLNSNVVQSVVDDTNITGTISAQALTLGWTGTLALSRGGTGSGTQQGALNNVMPTPTRAGDITYWNGTNWVALAGNNSGTKVLQETSSGVPSWASPGSGTVTSVGLSDSYGLTVSGSPVTTSGSISAGVSLSTLTNSLAANVSLNNTSDYFDGPSVSQGTSGTWLVFGSVTVKDTAGQAQIYGKLWDGTTVIASGDAQIPATGERAIIALSGVISSPAGNLRISCSDITSTSGLILFNESGNSKDSTITAVRIA